MRATPRTTILTHPTAPRAMLPVTPPATRLRTLVAMLLLALVPALAGCDDEDPVAPQPGEPIEQSFTFDTGMEGWADVAIDTLEPPIEWRVAHTTDGNGAVELHLENLNDQGKIWMERGFDLEPGTPYTAEIRYAFGTSDWGDVNLFTIIAGAHAAPPRTPEDLVFREDTGHDEGDDAGVVWLEKAYEMEVTAPDDGTVYVTIGVWGTWEAARTYYVDDVTVRFTP